MEIREMLRDAGLKVTTPRLAVLGAVLNSGNHPTADQIKNEVHKLYPSVATGTIYKVLENLEEKGLLKRVDTDKEIMRYDGMVKNHHHIISKDSDVIEDYHDETLDELLQKHFRKKGIPNFQIEQLQLNIKGTFKRK